MAKRFVTILLVCIGLLTILVFALTFLSAYLPGNRNKVKPEFERRWSQWEESSTQHYRMTVWVRSFGSSILFCSPAVVEVVNGNVIDVQTGPYQFDLSEIPKELQDCLSDQVFRDTYGKMTVDYIFELIKRDLEDPNYFNVRFELAYDEHYGFPVSASMWSPSIDHLPQYSISGFELLPKQ